MTEERKKKKVCCCVEAKTGTFIVAFIELIFYGLFFVTSLALLFIFHSSDQELDLDFDEYENTYVKINSTGQTGPNGPNGQTGSGTGTGQITGPGGTSRNLTNAEFNSAAARLLTLRWFYILIAFMQILGALVLLAGVLKRNETLLIMWLGSKILWFFLYRIFRYVYYGFSFLNWSWNDSDDEFDDGEPGITGTKAKGEKEELQGAKIELNSLDDIKVAKQTVSLDGVKFFIFFVTIYFLYIVYRHATEIQDRKSQINHSRRQDQDFGMEGETQPMYDLSSD